MNTIKKIVNNEGNFDDFLEKIELIYYNNQYTDDEEDNKKHEKIFNDLVENNGALELCRDSIENSYIRETFVDVGLNTATNIITN